MGSGASKGGGAKAKKTAAKHQEEKGLVNNNTSSGDNFGGAEKPFRDGADANKKANHEINPAPLSTKDGDDHGGGGGGGGSSGGEVDVPPHQIEEHAETLPEEDIDYSVYAPDPVFEGASGYYSEDRDLTFVDPETQGNLMKEYCDYIFSKTDMDNDGVLMFEEFANLVFSATLHLQLTDEMAYGIFQKAMEPEMQIITKEGFIGVMRYVILRHAQVRKEEEIEGWMWFGMYFDDEPESLPVYINATDLRLTYDRPSKVAMRAVDVESFEQVVLNNGTVYTTRIDESGERVYLDYETGEWVHWPDEWNQDIATIRDSEDLYGDDGEGVFLGEGAVDGAAPEQEEFTTPNGTSYQALLEGGRRTLWDEEGGCWIPMPVALEIYVPRVTAALAEMEKEMPQWRDAYQRVLALRECSYNVDRALEWKRQEQRFAPDGSGGGNAGSMSAATTAAAGDGSMAAAAATMTTTTTGADTVVATSGEVTFDASSALAAAGGMTLEARQQQAELESEVVQLKHQLQETNTKAQMRMDYIKDLEKQAKRLAQAASREQEDKIKQLEADLSTAVEGSETRLQLEKAQSELAIAQGLAGSMRETAGRIKFEVESLRTEQAALRQSVERDLLSAFAAQLRELGAQMAAKAESAVADATKDLVAKYRFEVRQRKLIYNKLQELKGNIRVFCRVRYDSRVKCALSFPDAEGMGDPTEVVCPDPKGQSKPRKFEFDRVYNPKSTQEEVFEDTEAIMTSCVDGYNVCLIAYGQTGSGKTYTMMGTESNPGVNRRAVKEVLALCQKREDIDYEIHVALLEIYNEKIIDLLSDKPVEAQGCDVKQDPKTKKSYVANLTEHPVTTEKEVVRFLDMGDKNRSVAATKMNSVSSRSHCVLQIRVTGVDKLSGQKSEGTLNLVDLAGSERVAKTEASGQRLVEAAAINKSLTALGQVFTGLRTNQTHIPYRNSKLTHMLKDSLGGDAKACIFMNVSPADSNLSETMGTLKFGTAIRTIELGPLGKTTQAKAAKKKTTAAAPTRKRSK